MTPQQAREILAKADLIYSAEEILLAIRRVADLINMRFTNEQPLVLSVLGGGVVFTGQLLPLLTFPLEFDYIHVSRYGDKTKGGQLSWTIEPHDNVKNRVVLVVDDILDEGETLNAIREKILGLGAKSFYSAVFADKQIGKPKPIKPDFIGLKIPNRFVFGFGMDVSGAWRNLPAIYAIREHDSGIMC